MGATLPHDPGEPFHTALVERMDEELDLLDRGPARFTTPLEAVTVARYDADTTGPIRYEQLFADRLGRVLPPTPLPHLLALRDNVLASMLAMSTTA